MEVLPDACILKTDVEEHPHPPMKEDSGNLFERSSELDLAGLQDLLVSIASPLVRIAEVVMDSAGQAFSSERSSKRSSTVCSVEVRSNPNFLI